MWTWMNSLSPEALIKLYNRLHVAIWVFGSLTIAASVLIWKVNARITTLRDEREGGLREKVVTLEANQAPRRLTPDQRTRLIGLLSSAKGTEITVAASLDPEASSYADEFVSVLREAGWNVSKEDRLFKGMATGIAVTIRDAKNPPSGANLLATAFKTVGLQGRYIAVNSVPEGKIELLVGHKPQ